MKVEANGSIGLNQAQLHHALLAASRSAFAAVRQAHASEQFYVLGLYTSGEGAYVSPTGNTEEALQRRFGGLLNEEPWLRWNPADWEYHLVGDDVFTPVRELLAETDSYQVGIDVVRMRDRAQQVSDICIQVLRELDGENAFGAGVDRERVVVNLWKGDQSDEERLEWAKRLNPETVWRRFERELEEAASALDG